MKVRVRLHESAKRSWQRWICSLAANDGDRQRFVELYFGEIKRLMSEHDGVPPGAIRTRVGNPKQYVWEFQQNFIWIRYWRKIIDGPLRRLLIEEFLDPRTS